MVSTGRGRSRLVRVTRRQVVATAMVLAASTLVPGLAGASHPTASLGGSNFEIDVDANLKVDDNPGIDWASVIEDRQADAPTGRNDDSFGEGTKEDTAIPAVVSGSIPPNKSDLLNFGVHLETNTNGKFLHVFWHRVQEPTGTTNMDFEFNQSKTISANGVTPVRAEGDLLVQYDLSQGGVNPKLFVSTWKATGDKSLCEAANSTPCWGKKVDLSASGDATGSINTTAIPSAESDGLGNVSPRTFGEATIDFAALVGNVSACTSFGSAYLKSRSSDSFTSALKDFIAPVGVNVTNCGSITIHKKDDAGAPLGGVEFELYVNGLPLTAPRGDATTDPLTNPRLACTTAANGNCTITNVPFGAYWVHEVSPPLGYTGAADQAVVVGPAGNTPSGTLTFTNNRNPASVTLLKQDDTGAAMANVTFTLYNNAAPLAAPRGAEDTAVNPAKSCTTGAAGTCAISGILPVGNFWLVETVPAGYTGAPDRAITLSQGQALDLTSSPFVNKRQFRVVTFVCIDSTDTLHGAKVSYDGAPLPAANNTPVVGGAITSTVESAVCGLNGTAVHGGDAGAHSSSVSIP